MIFSKGMNCVSNIEDDLVGYDKSLFEERLNGYKKTSNPYNYQSYNTESFLK